MVGAGAGAGADVLLGEVRRGAVRGAVVLGEVVDVPAVPADAAPFGSTTSGSSLVSVPAAAGVELGTVMAIGALDETGSVLPLEPLLRTASAMPPPSSAATRMTAIQTPGPMPDEEDACVLGGGIDGIRCACAGPGWAIAAEGNMDLSIPAFCDQGLAPPTAGLLADCGSPTSAFAGGGGGRIPPGGMSIFVVGIARGSSCWTFMSGEIRTFDMSIVAIR